MNGYHNETCTATLEEAVEEGSSFFILLERNFCLKFATERIAVYVQGFCLAEVPPAPTYSSRKGKRHGKIKILHIKKKHWINLSRRTQAIVNERHAHRTQMPCPRSSITRQFDVYNYCEYRATFHCTA